jgi:hypothetical protein
VCGRVCVDVWTCVCVCVCGRVDVWGVGVGDVYSVRFIRKSY